MEPLLFTGEIPLVKELRGHLARRESGQGRVLPESPLLRVRLTRLELTGQETRSGTFGDGGKGRHRRKVRVETLGNQGEPASTLLEIFNEIPCNRVAHPVEDHHENSRIRGKSPGEISQNGFRGPDSGLGRNLTSGVGHE